MAKKAQTKIVKKSRRELMAEHRRKVTVGEFRSLLKGIPADWEITFAGVLEFNRIKQRDAKLIDVEFNERIYRTKRGALRASDD